MSRTEMSASPTYRIVSVSMLTAVTAVFTMLIRVPIAPTRGYINLGDVAIFFTAFTFGPLTALISGGLGTAIADLLSGYAQWAPISLFIHGLQGLIAGLIARRYLYGSVRKAEAGTLAPEGTGGADGQADSGDMKIISLGIPLLPAALAGLVGSVIMVGLYFLAAAGFYGFGPAAVEVPGNIIQCAAGFTGGFLLNRTVVRAYPPVHNLYL